MKPTYLYNRNALQYLCNGNPIFVAVGISIADIRHLQLLYTYN